MAAKRPLLKLTLMAVKRPLLKLTLMAVKRLVGNFLPLSLFLLYSSFFIPSTAEIHLLIIVSKKIFIAHQLLNIVGHFNKIITKCKK